MKKIFLLSLFSLLLFAISVVATPGVTIPAVNSATVDVSGSDITFEDLDITRNTGNTYAITVKGDDADFNTSGTVTVTQDPTLSTSITVVAADSDFETIGTGTDTFGITVTIKDTYDYKNEIISLGTVTLSGIIAENSTDSVTIADKTFNLFYDAKSRLVIGRESDLDDIGLDEITLEDQFIKVSVDGDSDTVDYDDKIKVKPTEEMSFEIEVSNLFSDDMKIENVEANLFIEGFDGDDDDIDVDEDIDDIKDGKDEKTTIDIEVPYNIEEGIYDATISVVGEDENGAEHSISFDFTIDVDRKSKELLIRTSKFNKASFECGESNPRLSFTVINMGTSDRDDVGVRVECEDLDFYFEDSEIELDQVQDDVDDGTYAKTLTIDIPENTEAGEYKFYITALIDDNEKDGVIETLTVKECVPEVEEEVVSDTNSDNNAVINNPINIVPEVAESTNDVAAVTGETTNDTVSKEDNSYLILLAAGNVVLFVAVVGLLIAVMTGKKPRRD